MTQQIINVDGAGESLRTAFESVNNNFSQIWASGPVNTNVVIANNVISTTPVNTPLVLAPGGIGNIQANAHVVPGVAGVYTLGGSSMPWDRTYSNYFYGNGFFLTGVQAANVTALVNGNSSVVVQNANGVITVNVNSVPNVAVFTSTGLNVSGTISSTGNISAPYFIGDGSQLSNIVATGGSSIDNGNSNVRINASAANVTVGVSGVGNVAVFTPTGLQVSNSITATTLVASGNITASRFVGNGATLSSITGSNVTGTVPQAAHANSADAASQASLANLASLANVAMVVSSNAQPNITSVGNLVSVTVTGNAAANNVNVTNRISAASITVTGNIVGSNANLGNTAQANYFVGNGSLLTGIQASTGSRIENGTSNINIATANGNATVGINGTSNVATFSASGLAVAGNVTATRFVGDGGQLSNITAANITGNVAVATYAVAAASAGYALTANTVTASNQPNITTVGILSSLSVVGNIQGNYLLGNGRFLTGIAGGNGGGSSIENGNSNVAISVSGGNVAIGVAGVANTVIFASNTATFSTNVSVAGSVSAAGNVSASGNVAGNYILGNGALLTGVVTSASNISSGNSSVSILTPGGNVVVDVGGQSSVAEFSTNGLSVQGNVTAEYFVGNVIGNISGNLSVPGANTQVLYNNNGQAGASAGFTFNQASNVLSVVGNVVAAGFTGSGIGLTSTMSDKGSDTNNWNALLEMGTYTVNRVNWGGVTGPPLDSLVYVGLLTVSASNTVPGVEAVQQVFAPGTVDPNNIKVQWIRNYWSGSWTPWVKMVNDVQQIDGGSF